MTHILDKGTPRSHCNCGHETVCLCGTDYIPDDARGQIKQHFCITKLMNLCKGCGLSRAEASLEPRASEETV